MQYVVQPLYHKLSMHHLCPCLNTVNSENKTQEVSNRVSQFVDGETGIWAPPIQLQNSTNFSLLCSAILEEAKKPSFFMWSNKHLKWVSSPSSCSYEKGCFWTLRMLSLPFHCSDSHGNSESPICLKHTVKNSVLLMQIQRKLTSIKKVMDDLRHLNL